MLSKELGVSEVSIRKDLQFLERRGLIERIHGGGQLTRSGIALLHLSERYNVNRTAKQKIALEAVRRLDRPGLQIYIDTGTTNALAGRGDPERSSHHRRHQLLGHDRRACRSAGLQGDYLGRRGGLRKPDFPRALDRIATGAIPFRLRVSPAPTA